MERGEYRLDDIDFVLTFFGEAGAKIAPATSFESPLEDDRGIIHNFKGVAIVVCIHDVWTGHGEKQKRRLVGVKVLADADRQLYPPAKI